MEVHPVSSLDLVGNPLLLPGLKSCHLFFFLEIDFASLWLLSLGHLHPPTTAVSRDSIFYNFQVLCQVGNFVGNASPSVFLSGFFESPWLSDFLGLPLSSLRHVKDHGSPCSSSELVFFVLRTLQSSALGCHPVRQSQPKLVLSPLGIVLDSCYHTCRGGPPF